MTPLLVILATIGGVAATILLMFLPAMVELWKPKDAGPRLIAGNFPTSILTLNNPLLMANFQPNLTDIEGELAIPTIYAKTLGFLPNIELFMVE
jgi:hypothetical protein